MADKIVMGYWDCPSCGSTGIPGKTYDCPNCGRQRGKEAKFYMKSGPVEYVPGHKVTGADWYCEYCGALNSAERTNCENCGSPKSDSKDDYFSLKEPKKPDKPAPSTNIIQSSANNNNTNKGSGNSMSWIKPVGIIAAIILMIVLINSFFSRPKDCTFDIQELTWENSVEVEEYKTFRESDWSVPTGGRLAYTNQEIRSYTSVLDHYESVTKSREVQDGGHYETSYSDNGDGTFTEHETFVPDYKTEYYEEEEPVYRDEPVYDTKYYYDIDRWEYERTETATGNDKNPYWPELNLTEKERDAGHTSIYKMRGILNYKKKEKSEEYTIDEDMWKEIKVGQTINVTIKDGKITEWSQ